MAKPSLIQLVEASGYQQADTLALSRAVNALYAFVGANLDERDWVAIMAQSNPLLAAEAALLQQWQNSAYLLRNAAFLTSAGYPDVAAELTYRQMAQRLGYEYSNKWSDGSAFAATSRLGDAALNALGAAYADSVTPPGVGVAYVNGAVKIMISRSGRAVYSASGTIDILPAGDTLLSPADAGGAVREGIVTITRDNGLSSSSSVYLLVGSHSPLARNFNATGATTADRLVLLGAGADDIRAGQGNDTLYGGDGNDTLFGNQGNDRIEAGNGADEVEGGQGADTIDGGGGNDRLWGGTTGADILTGGSGADQFRFTPTNTTVMVTDFNLLAGDSLGFPTVSGMTFATTPSASGTPLQAADFDVVSFITDVRADTGGNAAGNNQVYAVRTPQSTLTILSDVAFGALNAYVLVFDSTRSQTLLYFDSDWSNAAGRVEVATLIGLSAADLQVLGRASVSTWS